MLPCVVGRRIEEMGVKRKPSPGAWGMSDRLLVRATIFRPLLDRRTRDRPVGAEYAAISLLRGQGFATAVAGVEESAGVGRHGLRHAVTAVRARDLGLELHGTIL